MILSAWAGLPLNEPELKRAVHEHIWHPPSDTRDIQSSGTVKPPKCALCEYLVLMTSCFTVQICFDDTVFLVNIAIDYYPKWVKKFFWNKMKTNYAISGELFFKISILEDSLRHYCYLHSLQTEEMKMLRNFKSQVKHFLLLAELHLLFVFKRWRFLVSPQYY